MHISSGGPNVQPAGKIKHNTIYSENDTNNVSDEEGLNLQ